MAQVPPGRRRSRRNTPAARWRTLRYSLPSRKSGPKSTYHLAVTPAPKSQVGPLPEERSRPGGDEPIERASDRFAPAAACGLRRRFERLGAGAATVIVDGRSAWPMDLSLGGVSFQVSGVPPERGTQVAGSVTVTTPRGSVSARFQGHVVWRDAAQGFAGVRFEPMRAPDLDGLMAVMSFLTAERDREFAAAGRRERTAAAVRRIVGLGALALAFALSAVLSHRLLEVLASN